MCGKKNGSRAFLGVFFGMHGLGLGRAYELEVNG